MGMGEEWLDDMLIWEAGQPDEDYYKDAARARRVWIAGNGDEYKIKKMSTQHILNCIKMIDSRGTTRELVRPFLMRELKKRPCGKFIIQKEGL